MRREKRNQGVSICPAILCYSISDLTLVDLGVVHLYRYRLAAFCLSHVVNHIFSARQQDYQQLLQLDMKLRKFLTPTALLCPTSGNGEPVEGRVWSPDSMQALQQYQCLSSRESSTLMLWTSQAGSQFISSSSALHSS